MGDGVNYADLQNVYACMFICAHFSCSLVEPKK